MMQELLEERAALLGQVDEVIMKGLLLKNKVTYFIDEMENPTYEVGYLGQVLEDLDYYDLLIEKSKKELRTYEQRLDAIDKEIGETYGTTQL